MTLKYLLDENVAPIYKFQLLQQNPELTVCTVGEPNVPPTGTLDPEILCWCEEHDFILVTNNRTSMPVHLTEHIDRDRHIPGILILDPDGGIGNNLEELLLIAEYSFEDEYRDQIRYLPLRKQT